VSKIIEAIKDTFFGFLDLTMQWEHYTFGDRLFFIMPFIAIILGLMCTAVGVLSGLHIAQLEQFQIGVILGKMFFACAFLFFALDIYIFFKLGRGNLN